MNKLKLTLLALLVFAFSSTIIGCSDSGPHSDAKFRDMGRSSAPWIQKGEVIDRVASEGLPLVWNSRLIYLVSARPSDGSANGQMLINVVDQETKAVIASHQTDLGFISAIVVNGVINVFGTTDWTHDGNSIEMISTSDLVNWTAPVVVITAPSDTTLFNSTVTQDDTGFVMAYELCQEGQVCYNFRFIRSDDLATWTDAGQQYEVGYYSACPTIRYVDGKYYVFFVSEYVEMSFAWGTLLMRSDDLKGWEMSKQTALSPFDGDDHSRNASDMDLIEFDGKVRMIYYSGPQLPQDSAGGGLREASFDGTMSEFLNKFFN